MNFVLGVFATLALASAYGIWKIWQAKKSTLEKFYAMPAFGGVNAALGISVGYLGSHFDKEVFGATLRPYIPAGWTNGVALFPGTLTFGPIIFWPVAYFAVWGIYKSLTAQSAAAAKVNEEFREAFERLFTMPSKGFLEVYKEAALASTSVVSTLPATLTVDKLETIIRSQLDHICKVVKRYDNEALDYTYGCNVMFYYGTSTSEFLARTLEFNTSIKCIERGVAIHNLAGVLQLKLPLSVRSNSRRQPDNSLTPLALPVPAIQGAFDEFDFVPGAPLAFASKAACVYPNQKALVGMLESNRRFSSIVLDDLNAILHVQTSSVQGLICIPLYDFDPDSYGPRFPIGVLNIHKNRTDEFISDKFSILEPLLAPLVLNLEKLISTYPK